MKLKRNVTLLLGLALCALPQALSACAVCAGGRSDSALAEGMNMGILTLLGVVFFVLGSIATFGIYLVRRSAAVNRRARGLSPGFQPATQES